MLSDKTSFAYVDGRLDLKADTNNVFTKVQSLSNFAGTQQMSEVLNLLQITTQLGTVTGDLTGKANQTYVDQQLALKANQQDPQLDGTATVPQRQIKFTSNLAGDKISLYEDQNSLGIAPYTMTQTIPGNTNDFSFKFYGCSRQRRDAYR